MDGLQAVVGHDILDTYCPVIDFPSPRLQSSLDFSNGWEMRHLVEMIWFKWKMWNSQLLQDLLLQMRENFSNI